MSRPTMLTEAVAAAICQKLADGESLIAICRNPAMPSRSTVHRWIREEDAFRERYVRAREDQADALADQVLEIADAAAGENRSASAAKLRIEARRWAAAKLKPRRYGERAGQDGAGDAAGSLAEALRAARERRGGNTE